MKSVTKGQLLLTTLLSGAILGFGATSAMAQTGETQTSDEIIVTGSRIKRKGYDTMQPTTVVDKTLLDARGHTNVADALNELPAFATPLQTNQGDQSSYSVGQNFVDFFGLGSQRTLTLVNGRRFVSSNTPTIFSGDAAGLQVDLNTIPQAMVERIETVAIGGAPIYGSDAIAGTVNVIMKEDFEGMEVNASMGISGQSDMQETSLGLVLGNTFADDRGNITMGIEYNQREGLIENQRDFLAVGYQFREPAGASQFTRVLIEDAHANIVSEGGALSPGNTLLPTFGIGSFTNPAGNQEFLEFKPDGSIGLYDVGQSTGNAVWSIGGSGIFLPDVTNLFTPFERTIFTTFANYQLTEDINFFTEVFAVNATSTELANQPAYQSGFFGEGSFRLRFNDQNPFLTASARQTLADYGITDFSLHRASVDLRPEGNAIDNESFLRRMVIGLDGELDFGDRAFNWEVAYNIGQSDGTSRRTDIDNIRLFYALDAVIDPATGLIECNVKVNPPATDPATPLGTSLPQDDYSTCVPINFFGKGAPSVEAIDYVTKNVVALSALKQEVFSATIGGDLIDLPAGPLQVATGFFHRVEEASFEPGGFLSGSRGRVGPVGPISGDYSTNEYYVEGFAPLLNGEEGFIGIPLKASVEGAFRVVDNSLAGSDNTWTIGGRISPIEDLEFRGNRTISIRAPAITELFLPNAKISSFANDPCDQRFVDQGNNPATRRANCIADGITDPNNFASNVANASVQGFTGGNPNLQNETARAWTVGVVAKPRFVPGLTVAADYYKIDIEERIEQFTLTQIMESCYDATTFPNTFCNGFNRLPSGQLPAVNAFQSGFVNAGNSEFQAISVNSDYTFDVGDLPMFNDASSDMGSLSLGLNMYFLLENTQTLLGSTDDDLGELGNSKVQAQFNTTYNRGPLSVFLQSRFIGEGIFQNNDTPTSRDILGEGNVLLFNGGVSYDFEGDVTMRFNVNNIFDKEPSPGVIAAGFENVYDTIGRYYRLSATKRF